MSNHFADVGKMVACSVLEVYPTAPIPMALEGTTEPETWLEPEEMRF